MSAQKLDIKEIYSQIRKLSLPMKAVIGGSAVLLFSLLFLFPSPKPPKAKGIEKPEKKGFELFEKGSWLKGERELTVLSLRALKGEIEKDLASFENVKAARVILDLPFNDGEKNYKPKLSCILELKGPEAPLAAIIAHLVGAVHGLEESHIAISDTKGNIYCNYGLTLIQEDVSKKQEGKKSLFPYVFKLLAISIALLGAIVGALFIFKKKRKEDDLSKVVRGVNITTLATLIQGQSSSTIALMLSYLEKPRRELLIKKLPQPKQEEVLFYLSELESSR